MIINGQIDRAAVMREAWKQKRLYDATHREPGQIASALRGAWHTAKRQLASWQYVNGVNQPSIEKQIENVKRAMSDLKYAPWGINYAAEWARLERQLEQLEGRL